MRKKRLHLGGKVKILLLDQVSFEGEWRAIKTGPPEIFDEIAPLRLAAAWRFDVEVSRDQAPPRTGDIEGPKTRFHQCRPECPNRTLEPTAPDIFGTSMKNPENMRSLE